MFNKILIRRVDNLGDIVIALPLISALKRLFPKSTLFIMAKEEHFPLFYKYSSNFLKPIKLKPGTLDPLSALYFIRMQDFQVGEQINIDRMLNKLNSLRYYY